MQQGRFRQGTSSTVQVWEEDVTFPSYPLLPPDRHPMFLERRVYQGSSGAIYPLPLIDRIADKRTDQIYRGVYLENEYIRILVLPQLGGRIHALLDKTNNHHAVYYNHVIKPALVGLAGPWIAGGIEFNWPQHHRPTTFLPVDYALRENDDGSKTVWVGEIEPMNRTKGMAGITLHPGRSFVEVTVQLYNRTSLPQAFLWWSNLAAPVNEHYQAIFPPDVEYVADHAKRAVSDFPIAHGSYYGIDYAPGTDISWWKNIPVPTSYMALHSAYDFLAGYDHDAEAGIVHVADHHVSPGKKLWTWGAGAFGRRWYEHLTDDDGPYIELMTGVYSDNQPDFAWIQPMETKTFTQYWYPLRGIGGVSNATTDGAISIRERDGHIEIGVNATTSFHGATITVSADEEVLWQRKVDVAPDKPFHATLSDLTASPGSMLSVAFVASDGRELVRYHPTPAVAAPRPAPSSPAAAPDTLSTVEQLYLTGLHLEQYRHGTYDPDPYYREALARDPGDARSNAALGSLLLRRGAFAEAVECFRRAVATLTVKNPNPYDGEPLYLLGVALRFLGRDDDAYASFYKATWNGAWQSAGYLALAELACRAGKIDLALSHADRSLENGWRNTKARGLKACLLRRLSRLDEAEDVARETCRIDALDVWSRSELVRILALQQRAPEAEAEAAALHTLLRSHAPSYLDLAADYGAAGLWNEALAVLTAWTERRGTRSDPLVYYYMGYYAARQGNHEASLAHYRQAEEECPDYCFPNRLDSIEVLQHAQREQPQDARAPYYLGNLLYDKKQYVEAIRLWERSRALCDTFSIVHRNLGLAYYNSEHNPAKARVSFAQAFAAAPMEARLLSELDGLDKRLNASPAERLARLDAHADLVEQRDDLYLERVALCNQLRQYGRALDLLGRRRFRPWEGGEGMALEQHAHAHLQRGRTLLQAGRLEEALRDFRAARSYPTNLGEARHEVLMSEAAAYYYTGLAHDAIGDRAAAARAYERAAGERSRNADRPYYRGLACRRLGRDAEAAQEFASLLAAGDRQLASVGGFDFFATSAPSLSVLADDGDQRNAVEGHYLRALGYAGRGSTGEAIAEAEATLDLDINHLGAQTLLDALKGSGQDVVDERL